MRSPTRPWANVPLAYLAILRPRNTGGRLANLPNSHPVIVAGWWTGVTPAIHAPGNMAPRFRYRALRYAFGTGIQRFQKSTQYSKFTLFSVVRKRYFFLKPFKVSASRARFPTIPGFFSAASNFFSGIFFPLGTPRSSCRAPGFPMAPEIQFFLAIITPSQLGNRGDGVAQIVLCHQNRFTLIPAKKPTAKETTMLIRIPPPFRACHSPASQESPASDGGRG